MEFLFSFSRTNNEKKQTVVRLCTAPKSTNVGFHTRLCIHWPNFFAIINYKFRMMMLFFSCKSKLTLGHKTPPSYKTNCTYLFRLKGLDTKLSEPIGHYSVTVKSKPQIDKTSFKTSVLIILILYRQSC